MHPIAYIRGQWTRQAEPYQVRQGNAVVQTLHDTDHSHHLPTYGMCALVQQFVVDVGVVVVA
jgi:hypothetical protein